MDKLFEYVDKNQDRYVKLLEEAVAIKSVSAWPETRPEIRRMVTWTKELLEKLGSTCNLEELGQQTLPDGSKIELPPVLMGQLGNDPKKKTLLVYGHLDVQPAQKGPVLDWINAIQAMQELKMDVPVNLKGVDYVCISDNYWLGKKKPCITYGLSHEAMTDLIALMGALVDVKGKILVPGVYDTVKPLTADEKALYDPIDFDMEDYRNDLGAPKLIHDKKEDVLMHRWRYPSLSLHGIEGAFSAPGAKTVIPRKVIGKFSIRLVPDQEPDKIEQLVRQYIDKLHKDRGSPNTIK
nr:hypothetical protein BaRGS_002141 [Batillaria attramentaria]